MKTIRDRMSKHWVIFLAVGLSILLTAFAAYSAFAQLPNPTPDEYNCEIDNQGANDQIGQKDLTQMCEDLSRTTEDPPIIYIKWNWDKTGWTGKNTGDGCSLYDVDPEGDPGYGFADYALCVTVHGDPALQYIEEPAYSPRLYGCTTDSSAEKCTGPNLLDDNRTLENTSCTAAAELPPDPGTDPFGPSVPNGPGENYPFDTVAECEINLNDIGGVGVNIRLLDVCSYASEQPNSDPSDCIRYSPKIGTIKINKIVEPESDPGLFILQIDGDDYSDCIGNGGTTGDQSISEGIRTISEIACDGTSFDDYTTTYACTLNGGAGPSGSGTWFEVDLADKDNYDCTFINSRQKAKLTVVKDPTNDSGGTASPDDFLLTVNGGAVLSDIENEYNANTNLALGETPVAGYEFVRIDDDDSGRCPSALGETFQLQPGDDVTCTIVNDDQPSTLIVKKVLINDNGGTKVNSDFEFSVNGAAAISFEADGQNDLTVDAGTYSVVETAVSGYTTTYDNCTNVVIANGGSTTCTITNNDIDYKPIIKIVKTGPTTAKVGDTVTYNFEVTNDDVIGDGSPIDNVSVTDTIAGTATYVSGDTGADGILEVGETWIFTANYIILTTDPNPLVNTGTANGKDLNVDPVSDNDDHSLNLEYWTDLSITKEGPVDEVVVGSNFNFYITVHNAGPSPAVNVVVTDTVPSDLSYVTAFPIPDDGPSPVVWNLGTMAPGQTEEITLTVHVEPWAQKDTINYVTNYVQTTTETNESDYTNNEDEATVEVPPGTAVTVTDFRIMGVDGYEVTIQWITETEVDAYGFKIYRSQSEDFDSAEYIPPIHGAVGIGGNGDVYTHTDTVLSNGTWYYWMTVISTSDVEGAPHGAISATIGDVSKIFLPIIIR